MSGGWPGNESTEAEGWEGGRVQDLRLGPKSWLVPSGQAETQAPAQKDAALCLPPQHLSQGPQLNFHLCSVGLPQGLISQPYTLAGEGRLGPGEQEPLAPALVKTQAPEV